MSQQPKKFLFILTGSISIYKTMSVLSRLVQNGHSVEVVMTKSALKFIGTPLVEGLIGKKVHTDLWEDGSAMSHIQLGRDADHICVCPATADFINKISCGIADDLASSLFLAHDFNKPFSIYPAMNTKMWEHPATKNSINTLRSWGLKIFEPNSGTLACGELGSGRLMEPDEIYSSLFSELEFKRDAFSMTRNRIKQKVLITSGGTSEKIDSVRRITNLSSGQTGAQLAQSFLADDFEVHFLLARGSAFPDLLIGQTSSFHPKQFTTCAELRELLSSLLTDESFDIVIQAAAVSDYSVAEIRTYDGSKLPQDDLLGKISSEADEMILKLKKNPKLINQVRSWSKNKQVCVVGFKLTDTQDRHQAFNAIQKLFQSSDCDWVVHNDVQTMQSEQHLFKVFKKNQELPIVEFKSKEQLANSLPKLLRTPELFAQLIEKG